MQVLFADGELGMVCLLWVVLMATPLIIRLVMNANKAKAAAEAKKEAAELRQRDPEKWMRLQEIEHEKKKMEHEQRVMRHDGMKTSLGVGAFILRMLLKR
jgi:hypothetical protein